MLCTVAIQKFTLAHIQGPGLLIPAKPMFQNLMPQSLWTYGFLQFHCSVHILSSEAVGCPHPKGNSLSDCPLLQWWGRRTTPTGAQRRSCWATRRSSSAASLALSLTLSPWWAGQTQRAETFPLAKHMMVMVVPVSCLGHAFSSWPPH